MDRNQLSRGIIVQQQEENVVLSKELYQLWSRVSLSVFSVAAAGRNASFQQQFPFRSPRVAVFVPHVLNSELQQLLQPASEGNFFNFRQAWLVMSPELDAARAVLNQCNINIDADITLGITLENATVLLYDVFKICHRCGSALSVLYKGSWSSGLGFQLAPEFRKSFIRRRSDFQGMRLNAVTTVREKPEHMLDLEWLGNDFDNKNADLMQRKTFQLMKSLEPVFNFSFEIRFMDVWGQLMGDSWNGVMGELVSGRAELTLCPLRYTRDRISVIRYTPAIHTEHVQFLFRHPRRNVIRNIFLDPFEDSVWWAMLVLVVASILLLKLLLHIDNRRLLPSNVPPTATNNGARCPRRDFATQERQRFDFSVLVILTGLFMQGPSPDTFDSLPSRVLVTTVCVFSFMLLQFYGAVIVSSLLSVPPRTITSPSALFHSPIEIGMENVPYTFELFQEHSPNTLGNDIYVKRICRNRQRNILPMEEGAKRIKEGGYAFYTGLERAYWSLTDLMTNREMCDLQEIPFDPGLESGAATTHNSPFYEHFTNGILRLRLSGLLQHNERKWQVEKPDCGLVKGADDVSVDIEHFAPALVFLVLAMVATIAVLLVELAIKWCREKGVGQRSMDKQSGDNRRIIEEEYEFKK